MPIITVNGNSLLRRVLRNRRAVSPAISIVIITAVTIVLVLVTSSYAYQILDRQRAAAEFDDIKSSVIAYDDAVRAIAWDRTASRSVRYKMTYGNLQFMPNALTLQVTASINGNDFSQTLYAGILTYSMPTAYVTFGNGYESYLLGDADQLSFSNESFSQALIRQDLRFVNITLQYRIRVTTEGPITVIGGKNVTYVDILLIRLTSDKPFIISGDFELVARNQGVNVYPSNLWDVGADGDCSISVASGGSVSTANMSLPQGTSAVLFNLIVGDVQVSA